MSKSSTAADGPLKPGFGVARVSVDNARGLNLQMISNIEERGNIQRPSVAAIFSLDQKSPTPSAWFYRR
jgi:hypothetical protein